MVLNFIFTCLLLTMNLFLGCNNNNNTFLCVILIRKNDGFLLTNQMMR